LIHLKLPEVNGAANMQNSPNLEESLRETACLGDVDKVQVLVSAGVDVNSQNKVNGWTALHWAAKRNHKHVVSYLLQSGAKPTIQSFKNELAADVTQSEEIKRLLLGEGNKCGKGNGRPRAGRGEGWHVSPPPKKENSVWHLSRQITAILVGREKYV
jgi:hypothetical protein